MPKQRRSKPDRTQESNKRVPQIVPAGTALVSSFSSYLFRMTGSHVRSRHRCSLGQMQQVIGREVDAQCFTSQALPVKLTRLCLVDSSIQTRRLLPLRIPDQTPAMARSRLSLSSIAHSAWLTPGRHALSGRSGEQGPGVARALGVDKEQFLSLNAPRRMLLIAKSRRTVALGRRGGRLNFLEDGMRKSPRPPFLWPQCSRHLNPGEQVLKKMSSTNPPFLARRNLWKRGVG